MVIREGGCLGDLVAWKLVDASAVTVVEATMFTVRWGFTVPEERGD